PFELTNFNKYLGKNKCFKKSAIWEGIELSIVNIPGYNYSANFILSNNIVKNRFTERTYIKKELSFNADSFFSFLGWYVAEGCSNVKRGEISIACNNTD